MVNLLAIWRAHGLDEVLRECLEAGVLIAARAPARCAGSSRASPAPPARRRPRRAWASCLAAPASTTACSPPGAARYMRAVAEGLAGLGPRPRGPDRRPVRGRRAGGGDDRARGRPRLAGRAREGGVASEEPLACRAPASDPPARSTTPGPRSSSCARRWPRARRRGRGRRGPPGLERAAGGRGRERVVARVADLLAGEEVLDQQRGVLGAARRRSAGRSSTRPPRPAP